MIPINPYLDKSIKPNPKKIREYENYCYKIAKSNYQNFLRKCKEL